VAGNGNRQAALNAAKLAALVTGRWGAGDRDTHAFGSGAALTAGSDAWVLPDPSGAPGVPGSGGADVLARALGPAMLWAERQGADRLHLLATGDPAGVLARQAALFAAPAPEVLVVVGTELAPAAPAPVPPRADAPSPPELVDLLIDAGLEVVVEGGILRGEVNGLEVARIVDGTTTAGVPIDAPLLEVGVGKADRELTAVLHGGMAPVDQLDRVVEIVRGHRHAGAPPHPLGQLAPDRWLRAALCRAPERVGLVSLRPVEGPRPRPNLRDRDVAVALGADAAGTPAVVACSVGGALDLVPLAADARAAVASGARLLLAVPERDDLPGNRRLAARLAAPAEVVPVVGEWREA
jgi:hypothetical protein